MPRLLSLIVAAALIMTSCSSQEDVVGVYEEALRTVAQAYGADQVRMYVFKAYCEDAGTSTWPPRCQEVIPADVREGLSQRLRGTANLEFIANVDLAIHAEFGIVRGGGVLVLLGAAAIDGDRAGLRLNWSDEDPRIQFRGWRLELRRSGGGWEVVDTTEVTGRITG